MNPQVIQTTPMTLADIECAGGYDLIYADPAWPYKNKGRGAAENHYKTMSVREIAAMPVPRLASENCILALWTVWPFLRETWQVLDAWGFEYKTCAFVWVKYHEKSGKAAMGGGFWTRANTEPCLLAVRGKPDRRVSAAVRQLIETGPEEVLRAPLQEHSEKPAAARDRLVELLGDRPRIELFARQRVAGWDAWGNQVPNGSDVTW